MIGDIIQGNYLQTMRDREIKAARSNFYFIPKTLKNKVLAAGLVATAVAYNVWDIGKDLNRLEKEQPGYSSFESLNKK